MRRKAELFTDRVAECRLSSGMDVFVDWVVGIKVNECFKVKFMAASKVLGLS